MTTKPRETQIEDLIQRMRALAEECRRWRNVPCQSENSWHADTYDGWADELSALLREEAPQGDQGFADAILNPEPPNVRLRALAIGEAFKAGFVAHYGKRPGDWVFDEDTCAARDLYPAAFKAWQETAAKGGEE